MEKTLEKMRKDRMFEESERGVELAEQIKQEKKFSKARQESLDKADAAEDRAASKRKSQNEQLEDLTNTILKLGFNIVIIAILIQKVFGEKIGASIQDHQLLSCFPIRFRV